jgi:hypothetical protein
MRLLRKILLWTGVLLFLAIGAFAARIADVEYHYRAANAALDREGYGERTMRIASRDYCRWWQASVAFLALAHAKDDPSAVGGDVQGYVCTDHFGHSSVRETEPGWLASPDQLDWEPND